MTAVVVKDFKLVGRDMAGQENEVRVVYDFAKDGGAIAAYHLAEAQDDLLIVRAHALILTAAGSTGSATVKWGPQAADARFMSTTQGAVAELTPAGKVILPLDASSENATTWAPVVPYAWAAGQKMIMTVGAEVLNAGKIQFVFQVIRP